MSELKPCPFCGGEAERIDIEDGENTGGSCICCTVCQASGNVEFERKENFVANWNRRAMPAGFALVPVNISAAMINAWSGGLTVTTDEIAYRTSFQEAWSRVLAASPPPMKSLGGSQALLRRMSLALDDLSPEDTIGFSNGVQWVEVATVEEIRKAETVSDELRSQVQFLPTEDGEFNGNEQLDQSQAYSQNVEVNDIDAARKWLSARWCIDHPNEGHVKQLAEYVAFLRAALASTEGAEG